MKIFCIAVLVLCSGITAGQDLNKIERDLLKQFQRIVYWDTCKQNGELVDWEQDSCIAANKLFRNNLLTYTRKYPATLTWKFEKLTDAGLSIATSEDDKFRIYSWDTETGGTMHIFETVYQYKADNKVLSKIIDSPLESDDGSGGSWYSDVWLLKHGNTNYYIGVNNAVYATLQCVQGVKIFTIENGRLNSNPRLIKTGTGIRNELSYEYKLGFVAGSKKTFPDKLIQYNTQNKTLSIPVVLENGSVTNRQIKYRFTGKYFEKISRQ